NPAAVRAPDVAAQITGDQVDGRRAVGFEINPADVGTPGVAAQIAERIEVHAKVGGGIVLILDAVGRRAAAEVDPADVGGINEAGADVLADDHAGRGLARPAGPVQPADVRAPGVFVERVDRRGGGGRESRM